VIPTDLLDRVEVLGERLAMVVWSGPDGVISRRRSGFRARLQSLGGKTDSVLGRRHPSPMEARRQRVVRNARPDQVGVDRAALGSSTKVHLHQGSSGWLLQLLLSADEGWATESILPFSTGRTRPRCANLVSVLRRNRSDDRAWACCSRTPETFSRVTGELSLALARWFSVQVVGTMLDLYGHGTIRAFVNATDPDNLIAFARDVGWLLHAAPPTYAKISGKVDRTICPRPSGVAALPFAHTRRARCSVGHRSRQPISCRCRPLSADGRHDHRSLCIHDDIKRSTRRAVPSALTLSRIRTGSRNSRLIFDCLGIEEVLHQLILLLDAGCGATSLQSVTLEQRCIAPVRSCGSQRG